MYNHGAPYLIVRDMQGHPKIKRSPQIQDLEMDRNKDMNSLHNSDLSIHVDDMKYRLLEERLKDKVF